MVDSPTIFRHLLHLPRDAARGQGVHLTSTLPQHGYHQVLFVHIVIRPCEWFWENGVRELKERLCVLLLVGRRFGCDGGKERSGYSSVVQVFI